MPELNGLDVIMELTREFLDVKVIAISGVPGYERLLDLAKLLGARQTLHKPFTIEELLSAVIAHHDQYAECLLNPASNHCGTSQ